MLSEKTHWQCIDEGCATEYPVTANRKLLLLMLETVASDAAPPSREWRHKEIPLLAAAATASNHPQNNPSGG